MSEMSLVWQWFWSAMIVIVAILAVVIVPVLLIAGLRLIDILNPGGQR